jgi:alpha-tubulin suppressor-like RCC1 family protein
MAVPGPFTCSSDAPAALEVSSDCATLTGRRLGTHTVSVSNGVTIGKASIKVTPQPQPIGTGASARYNLVATPDGRALAWGSVDAPLGQGSVPGQSVGLFLPTPVKAPTGNDALAGVVAVAAGEQQAFALTEDGEVYSWGAAPALGRTTTSGDKRPGKVLDPGGVQPLKGIVAVSTGGTNALALADDGTVYAWGDNTSVAGTEPKRFPVIVPGGKAVAIASGYLWNAVLLPGGFVATWGRNIDGALGQGSTSAGTLPPALVVDAATGNPISGIVSISAGDKHGFALTASGVTYGWGRNTSGQVGTGESGTVYRQAVTVSGPGGGANWTGLRMVAAGGNHALGLDSAGLAYSWGYSLTGELGDGPTNPRAQSSLLPGAVLAAAGTDQLTDVVAVGAGYGHSLALLSDGRLMVWGSGFNGILGQGGISTARSTLPLAVKNLDGSGPLNLGPVSYWPNLQRRTLP